MTISLVGCGLGRGALVVSALVDAGVVVVVERLDETVVVLRGLNDVVCFIFIVPVVGNVVLSFRGLTVVTTVGGVRVVTLTLFNCAVGVGLDVCVVTFLIGAVVGFTVTPTDGFGCFELTFNGLFVIATLFTVVVVIVGVRFVVLGNVVVVFVTVCVAFFK